jgi:hypothetical protein
MANPTPQAKFMDATQGWAALSHVLSRHIPFQLTHGGSARKALYTLMRPKRR